LVAAGPFAAGVGGHEGVEIRRFVDLGNEFQVANGLASCDAKLVSIDDACKSLTLPLSTASFSKHVVILAKDGAPQYKGAVQEKIIG
jgi:hypothetical protein